MNWIEALNIFKTISEQQTFSGAARKLKLNTAKVTTVIQKLEETLNSILFIRTTRRLKLTEEGHYLLKQIVPFIEEWENIQATFNDKIIANGGSLIIGTIPNILNSLPFSRWLTQFLLKNSSFKLDLKTHRKPFNFIDEDLDFFIGFESYIQEPTHIIARTLLNFNFSCYAAPEYIKKHSSPKSIAELKNHNCLIFSDSNEWLFKKKSVKVNGNFRADDIKALLSAACQGIGIIRVPDFLVTSYLENNTLILVSENLFFEPGELKLFYPKLSYEPQKIKTFKNYLIQKAKLFTVEKQAFSIIKKITYTNI